MRILFVTRDFTGASLCRRLADEGNEARAVVTDPRYAGILDGVVEKVGVGHSLGTPISRLASSPKEPVGAPALPGDALDWVGRDGLIVFDDSGFGQLQDDLRAAGYAVVGGCAGADRLEHDRPYCQQLLAEYGVRTLPTLHFPDAEAAIRFVKEQRGRWVIKQNGHGDKTFCYAGQIESGEDVMDVLRVHKERTGAGDTHVVLQRRVDGVELGVGRYFNGADWVGPVELNVEHKKFFPGDLGPKTNEMGTLLWYTDASNRLFREVLAPLAPHLREIGFHGDVDVNCIVNADGAWPLELTPRFGYPATAVQIELHESPWGEFLRAVATGQPYDLKWRRGYGIAVLAAMPPFPFCADGCDRAHSPRGLRIHFRAPPDTAELAHYHFEEAKRLPDGTWEICGDTGYVLHATGHGDTVEAARTATNRRMENLALPRLYYRADIGAKFASNDQQQLKEWGWL